MIYFNQYLFATGRNMLAMFTNSPINGGFRACLRPTQGKPKRGIAETRRITGEASGHGKPGGDLSKTRHDEKHDEADDRIRDQDRSRSGFGESLTSTNNHYDVVSVSALRKGYIMRRKYGERL